MAQHDRIPPCTYRIWPAVVERTGISNTCPNGATSFGRSSPLQYQGLSYEVSERERKMTPVNGLFRRILCFKFLRARLLRLGNSPARMSRRILPSNFPDYLPAKHRWD